MKSPETPSEAWRPARVARAILLTGLFLAGCADEPIGEDPDAGSVSDPVAVTPCAQAVDFEDPAYGGRIRQINRPEGQEHNHYYWRNVFNADNTFMSGIRHPTGGAYQVVLYDGNGCFLKALYTNTFNWQIAWSRTDPKIFYTNAGARFFAYDVVASKATLLKDVSAQYAYVSQSGGLSLNQAGDRVLMVVEEKSTARRGVLTYQLPGMTSPRFVPFFPSLPVVSGFQCYPWLDDVRYTGYLDQVGIPCGNKEAPAPLFMQVVITDTGQLIRRFTGGRFVNHYDFSPTGKLATYDRPGGGLRILVTDIATGQETVVHQHTAPIKNVGNLHLNWPDKVGGWLVVGLFQNNVPASKPPPSPYAPPMDELIQVFASGAPAKVLARTGSAREFKGSFWSQTQPSPSADGSRISFGSSCYNPTTQPLGCVPNGTIDQYVLFTSGGPGPGPDEPPDDR
jgi:hypothetical protein